MSDLLPFYNKTLTHELNKVGITSFQLTSQYNEDAEFIVYSPVKENGVKVKRDFSNFKKLKAVLSLYAGIEDIVYNETLNSPLIKMVDEDGLTNSMVEWCLAHTLRLHLDTDRHILGQDGIWRHKFKPPTAKNRKVSILGLGSLGKPVALFLNQIGFNVYGWSRTQKKVEGVKCLNGSTGLFEVLKRAEILILLLPLTKDTKFILDEDTLSLLPRNAKIINAGRGELIDDNALLRKLKSRYISNATLDVFQQEPLQKEHPYWILPHVTVTPHIAADTPIKSSSKVIAKNIKDLIDGKKPAGIVDLKKGY